MPKFLLIDSQEELTTTYIRIEDISAIADVPDIESCSKVILRSGKELIVNEHASSLFNACVAMSQGESDDEFEAYSI